MTKAGLARVDEKSQKLLGVYVDEHLNWTPHIDHLCATISSRISPLKQLDQYVPENIQKTFYQGYTPFLIDYDSNTWGATSNTNIERLNKLQKRAVRIILNAKYLTPFADMFKSLGWMSVNNRLKYNKVVFTYKAISDITSSYVSDLLKPIAKICSRTLRSSETRFLTVPRSRTALCEGSFSRSAPKLRNSIPDTVRMASTLNAFKKIAKAHICI